jgi:hypothetical protein
MPDDRATIMADGCRKREGPTRQHAQVLQLASWRPAHGALARWGIAPADHRRTGVAYIGRPRSRASGKHADVRDPLRMRLPGSNPYD